MRQFLLPLALLLATPAPAELSTEQRLAGACAAWAVDQFMLQTWQAKTTEAAGLLDTGGPVARQMAVNLRRLVEAGKTGRQKTAALHADLCPRS
jgi:hypothetical protein